MTEHEKRIASEGRKAMAQFIRKHGRKPSMAELDTACREFTPEQPAISKRTGKPFFRFAW